MSKFVEANEKLAQKVVEGYKKLEDGVVEGFGKVVDKCVEVLFAKDGEKQHTELDALKELDAKTKRPANVFAYIYGSLGAIVMGAGMILVALAYPVYNRVLKKQGERIAPAILQLTDELLK